MSGSGTTPQQRVKAESLRRGEAYVVGGCVEILFGREVDGDLIVVLGGDHARNVLGGSDGGVEGYWPRVWAARGLLHVWGHNATPAILHATRDPSWRVREMATKVVARHVVDEALDAVLGLRGDAVLRVRAAANRAVETLVNAQE